MNDQEIKALPPSVCPHCGQQVVIEFTATAPKLTGVFTVEMIEDTKKEVVEKIKALGLSLDKETEAIAWITNPETVFGPDDIDNIINGLKPNEPKESETESA